MTHQWRGIIEEYRSFLPVDGDTPVVTLLEGGTPLVPAPRLSERMGARVARVTSPAPWQKSVGRQSSHPIR